jgi:transcriptional regulator with XRE-family HTH domain
MNSERSAFVAWLRTTAAAAGFDPDVRGGIAALAKAAGIDAAPVSRAMSGEMIPKIDTQRALAKAMGVKPVEMYIRSGTIDPADLPSDTQPPAQPAEHDFAEIGRRFGIPPEKLPLFIASVEAVAPLFAESVSGDKSRAED